MKSRGLSLVYIVNTDQAFQETVKTRSNIVLEAGCHTTERKPEDAQFTKSESSFTMQIPAPTPKIGERLPDVNLYNSDETI